MYRVSRDQAHTLREYDRANRFEGYGGLKWLFSDDQQHAMVLFSGLVALDAPDVRTALVDFYSTVVGLFYGAELIMQVDPQHVLTSFHPFPAFTMRGLAAELPRTIARRATLGETIWATRPTTIPVRMTTTR